MKVKFLDLSYYKTCADVEPYSTLPIKSRIIDGRISVQPNDYFDYNLKIVNSEYGRDLYNLFFDLQDYNLLEKYSTCHGINFPKFYYHFINTKVKRIISEQSIDIEKIYRNYSKIYHFGSFEKIKPFLPGNYSLDVWRISLYHLVDEHIHQLSRKWYYENFDFRTCDVCGNQYRLANFPDWVYYGSNGHKNVCFECPTNQEISKNKILSLINVLIEQCGFIPNSDFAPINHQFSSRIKSENWAEVIKSIFEIGYKTNNDGSKTSLAKIYFGSWFKALYEAGVLPNDVLITKRGIKCIAKSGNECNSLDEQYIDNWLFEKGLNPIKEPFYPKHEKYNSSGRRRADWLIGDYYIEYFGLTGDLKYDKKTEEKINLIRDLNLKIIAIFPEDLNDLDSKFNVITKN